MNSTVTLSLQEYESLKKDIQDRDKQLEELREIIRTDEKYILLGQGIASFIQLGIKKDFILDFNYKTPNEFKEDSQKILEDFKTAKKELQEVFEKNSNLKWWQKYFNK